MSVSHSLVAHIRTYADRRAPHKMVQQSLKAKRLVSELKDKIGDLAPSTFTGPTAAEAVEGDTTVDAVSALVNLGYRRVEAFGAVSRARQSLGVQAEVGALIREGLKELAS